ncbi:MAG TPA: outer membrane lipoprotein chaperone LolA [Mariprofundaceae bacterium]|nr:outer membrane lipoprotein chaperone LolA [Mariprofundaceae bacterium]
MSRAVRTLLVACICWLVPGTATAAAMPAPLQQGIRHLAALQGFSCDFEQTLTFSDGSARHYTGLLDVRRPARFRWQYFKPYAQLYVSDGHGIWHYEPDLMQAEHLKSLDAVDPMVMRLLDGRVHAADIHLLANESQGLHPDVHRYKVRVGEGPQLWLGLRADGTLVYLESVDALGNRNRITLGSLSAIAPAAEVFSFSPPPGVDVVTDPQPSSNGVAR